MVWLSIAWLSQAVTVAQQPIPEPGQGEVLVRLKLRPVNPAGECRERDASSKQVAVCFGLQPLLGVISLRWVHMPVAAHSCLPSPPA